MFTQNLYMNIYSGSICNCQKTRNNPNVSHLVNGQTVVHPCNGQLLSNKKEQTLLHTTGWTSNALC